MKNYILFNPLAGNGSCKRKTDALIIDKEAENIYYDITAEGAYENLFSQLHKDDKIIICGGDGTLNRFVNEISELNISNDILYFAAGSGNDFLNDIGQKASSKPIKINSYIENLPLLYTNGRIYRFINGIGFGLDGYACAECNRLRKEKGKKVSYAAVALKGLLGAYTPVNATVRVDGKEYTYKKVWLASCMKGKFFGGGLKIAPEQQRMSPDGEVTSIIVHNLSRFRILTVFPSLFKGTHVKYTQYIDMKKCFDVTVSFDKPVELQIDGETVSRVTEYTVKIPKTVTV